MLRRRIEVAGIVQGVGFRPHVYRLAIERGLAGTIRNTASGVTIEVQGPPAVVSEFVERLSAEAPPLARITGLQVLELPCNREAGFHIVATDRTQAVRTLISPDVATCPECLRELFDPADRRYRYPFINCTNCGPRFTIVRNVPYDRPYTSMAGFVMCPACQAEYRDPLNRRFHAQPNACWHCGPQLQLWDAAGAAISEGDPVAAAAELLRAGKVVAIKGLGGFHLAVDAANAAAVAGLRERKRRVEKPFAVMVSDAEAAARLCEIDDAARAALQSRQRPIVLLRRKPDADVAPGVAPFNRRLGVFLPYTPLHHLLLAEGGFEALVMTSGNRAEEPIAIANQEAVERLQGLADFFLVHNRDILLRCDDSVVRLERGTAVQVRRSRGYVPAPVFLAHDLPEVLAVGGELKNTICLTKGRHAFLSQHIGDLENIESYSFFEEAVEHLSRVLEIAPRAIACDLHPDYFSTRWALGREGVRQVPVQHHHAHIAGCMAENHLDGRVIGIALDGTGYGTDGNIWGGEVLLADYAGFERAAHFDYVPMPGGDAAVREPWRMAVAYLAHHFGRRFLDLDIPFVGGLDRRAVEVVLRMLERGIHAPLTSSCGRLFDAVAALAGVRSVVNYEAQAAIELENLADQSAACPPYEFSLITGRTPWLIDTRPLFDAVLDDVRNQAPAGVISRRFHQGLGELFARVASLLRERTGLDRVCLSGGTFNNAYLSGYLVSALSRQGLQVFTHQHVPAGDGGLSLGQAMVAAHRVKGF